MQSEEDAMKFKKAVVNTICSVGDRMKPVLVKILPLSLSKKIKSRLIASAYTNDARMPYDKDAYPFGINLVGFIKAQMGLGQGCRLLASAIERTGIPFGIVETRVGNPFNHNDASWDEKLIKSPEYSINIFHVNPEQMPPLQLSLPSGALDKRYNIGVWLWELMDFPDKWTSAFSIVDEVWAPSVFNCENIRKKSPVPVTLIPYGIEAPCDEEKNRAFFGLSENKFLFLSMYDSNSTIERKNPLGAIKAYRKAFGENENGVGLVIKINNPTERDRELIKQELGECKNVYFLEKTYEKAAVNSLIKCCDAFVSLHRAEGFGLVIAEAMYVGTPVIATNWSANVDFMNEDNSCPVKYELTEIKEDCCSYEKGQVWAEPDTDDAARYMKKLLNDREYYEKLKDNAERFIKTEFSSEKSAEAVKKRIDEIVNGVVR